MRKFEVSQRVAFGTLAVTWSDGSVSQYNAVDMWVAWFRMSNDAFYDLYGFNFNPHRWTGLYERCRRIVYPQEN